MNLNGRLKRLERLVPEPADNTDDIAAVIELCQATIAAIDDGFIYDWQGDDNGRYLSPTSGHEHFGLRRQAEELITFWADATGWRSPSEANPAHWKAFRAGSAGEMLMVMVDILAVAKADTLKN
jgi:hypothetical protein